MQLCREIQRRREWGLRGTRLGEQGRGHAHATAPRVTVVDHRRGDLAFQRRAEAREGGERVREVGLAELNAEMLVERDELGVVAYEDKLEPLTIIRL